MNTKLPRQLGFWSATILVLASAFGAVSAAAQENPVKIGAVTFLSGAAAGPFGVPARNGAEIIVEAMNAGQLPAPYTAKGLGGAPVQLAFTDEAGGTTKQVNEYRNLVQRDNVDMVIGYISSGDCLAVAPLADELKKLTVFFDCGTPRIFEDASYKYLFRTGATATMDSVAAALYVTELKPSLKKYAGINQNYSWGQDSWNDFEAAMKVLKPGVEAATSQMPKLLAGQYGAEISTLLTSHADVVHTSFWGGDAEALILQGAPRGLFQKSTVVMTAGEPTLVRLGSQVPDGTVIGARGPFDVFAPDTELNRWFRKAYEDRYGVVPSYPAYKMAQAILGVKSAWEKAQAANDGKRPSEDQVIAAFEHLSFEGPGGKVEMALGKGHQAMQGTAYGIAKNAGGKITMVNVKTYPATKVTPPDGVKSDEWIKSGFKAGK
ncbi:MAG: ABC transporter substrate-binding protein [Bradyrhizobium sp.]|nr:ABC transporter substrate-binding protein [Bradyrhizobium sp.]